MGTTAATTKPKHPAKFSDRFGPEFRELLRDCKRVLDPFGGVGKLATLLGPIFPGQVYINEIEVPWAMQAPPWAHVTTCDAEHLPYLDGWFDAICTSPVYGNRLSDHHNAKDASRRNTYTHTLGRTLTEGNTGVMQWGEAYRSKHEGIWRECFRALAPGGLFILNISDHIRKGEVIPVTAWHADCLGGLGLTLQEHRKIQTPRQRHGANGGVRVDHESILVFRKEG